MELTVTILAAVMVATTAFYLLQAYKFDLQMMQQNSYRNDRYFKWWRMSKDYASMSRISDLAVFLLLVSMFPKVVTLPIAIIVFTIKAAILLKKKYKKPLVMTKRVWRLLSAMIVATLVVAALSCSPHVDAGINITAAGAALTAMAVLSWGVLALCNAAMQPVEKSINNSYVNDARRIIGEMPSLKVVGITGSYAYLGKDIEIDLNNMKAPVQNLAGQILQSGMIPRDAEAVHRNFHLRDGRQATRRHQGNLRHRASAIRHNNCCGRTAHGIVQIDRECATHKVRACRRSPCRRLLRGQR